MGFWAPCIEFQSTISILVVQVLITERTEGFTQERGIKIFLGGSKAGFHTLNGSRGGFREVREFWRGFFVDFCVDFARGFWTNKKNHDQIRAGIFAPKFAPIFETPNRNS